MSKRTASRTRPGRKPRQQAQNHLADVDPIRGPGRPRFLTCHPDSVIGQAIDTWLVAGNTWETLATVSGVAVKVLRRWYSRGEGPVIRDYLRAATALTQGLVDKAPVVLPPQPGQQKLVPGVAGWVPEILG